MIQWGGGGVVAEIFRRGGPGLQKAGSSRTFALITHFYMFTLSRRGARAPGPPGSATDHGRQNVALVAEVFRASEYVWHCMHARRDYSSQNWK